MTAPDPVQELMDSLLFEGYSLYPYTEGATKNSTPTPFGIVYPPVYAADMNGPLDHLQVEVVQSAGADCTIEGQVRFLQSLGRGHRAVERRVELAAVGDVVAIDFPPLVGTVSLTRTEIAPGMARVTLRVENHTVVASGLERAEALQSSLLSTHVLLRVAGGTFVSPLEAEGCRNVNTWPVLASPDDTVVLGAAIVLPDHPQLAPESRGSLFDSTEIEEALLLHVLALSDDERDQIAEADPAVREMVARAATAGPQELMRLHGVMKMED